MTAVAGIDTAEVTDLEPSQGPGARPVRAFVPRLLLMIGVLALLTFADPDPALAMVLIGFTGVLTIVSDARFRGELWLEERSLPSREAWVPILVLAALVGFDYVTGADVRRVVGEKLDVIAFILSFALVAEGLARCGFFRYLAFRITERCNGNTTRLILYLFLLASILTFVTSNDIVILTMTPIVMAVAYQSRMANAKLLLLSQFVAANTVSMGLLIGSPTNLILGRAVGLNFVEYFFLMIVPSIVALLATFVVITKIHEWAGAHSWREGGLVDKLVGSWDHAPSYATAQFSEYRSMDAHMRRWLLIFLSAVTVLAVATALEVSLFWAAVPIAVGALYFLSKDEPGAPSASRAGAAGRALRTLPFGIIFFGLVFFVLADGLGRTDVVRDRVVPFVDQHADDQTPLVAWGAIAANGVAVNVINDLPASALAGEVAAQAEFDSPTGKALVLQNSLVGLNTATYVTPIGALAGLIWFDLMRRERRRYARGGGGVPRDILTPTRRDMVVYGFTTFVGSGLIIGLTNYGMVSVADVLLGPVEGAGHFNPDGGRGVMVLLSASLLVLVPLAFRGLLIRHDVILSHMADLFVVITRFRVIAARHRLAYSAILSASLFLSAGALLYWAEHFHASHYPTTRATFHSVGGFITWLSVFIGSGVEGDHFPNSVIGAMLAAILALGSIAVVLFLVKASSSQSDQNLRVKIARGLIPTDRLVIFHATDERLRLAQAVLTRPGRFVVAIGASRSSRQLRLLLDTDHRDRALFVEPSQSMSTLVRDYDLPAVRELILMSTTKAEDFENLSLLSEIDRLGFLPGSDHEEQPALPRVLLECAMPDMEDLVRRSLSGALLARVRTVQLSDRFGEYLLAENHHTADRLSAYYGGGMLASDDELASSGITLEVRCPQEMVDVLLDSAVGVPDAPAVADSADRRHPWLVRRNVDDLLRERLVAEGLAGAPIVGVVVQAGDRLERLSLAAYSAIASRGPIRGVTVLQPATGGPAPVFDPSQTELEDVTLVNATSLAEQTAIALLEGGARAITYLVHEHARVPVELEDHPELNLVRSSSESMTASMIVDGSRPETRIIVFDDEDDRVVSTERLLEQLSAWRLSLNRSGESPPTLIVQCLGDDRREVLSRFVTDEVVDSSWIDRSFFEVLARVYLDIQRMDVTPGGEAFQCASAVASHLAAFDVHEARTLELQGPMTSPRPVVGFPLCEVAEMGNTALELVGPVVGLARLTVVAEGVHLRIASPLEHDVVVEADDLILVAPHI